MKLKIKFVTLILIFYSIFLTSSAFAEYTASQIQGGRYVMVVLGSSGGIYSKTTITKIPAVVLDTIMGIVWKCTNLQEERPRWVKTDLGKNQDMVMGSKRYTILIPQVETGGYKIPAIVLDMDEGKVWTCPNLMEEGRPWVQVDLIKDIKQEIKVSEGARY